MVGTNVSKETGKQLRKLIAQLANSISETLGSLVGQELVVQPQELVLTEAEDLLCSLERANAVVRGSLDKEFAGRNMLALFEVQDAVTMAGLLMMTPEEVIEENRQRGTLEGEDAEAFGELGNVLCSGLGNVLRDAVSGTDIRLQDHGLVKPGLDPDSLLAKGDLVAARLKLRIGSHADSSVFLVLDRTTAEAWNGTPLQAEGTVAEEAGAETESASSPRLSDDGLEDIPAAPIVGVLNAFVDSLESLRVLRRSCRRVGLELRKHNRAQIPNPAAHRDEIVLIEVPVGEERRFNWSRRIKDYCTTAKVVLLLHRPSRSRVTRAFLSRADAILGMPVEELDLSSKLSELIGQPI